MAFISSAGIDKSLLTQLREGLTNTKEQVESATKSAVAAGSAYFVGIEKQIVRTNEFAWKPLVVFPEIPGKENIAYKYVRKEMRKLASGTAKDKFSFLGKLKNAFRYSISPSGLMAFAGILEEKVKSIGRKFFGVFQEGQVKPVSYKMRRYFGMLGVHINKTKTAVEQPSRPLTDKAWEKYSGKIGEKIAEKLKARLK